MCASFRGMRTSDPAPPHRRRLVAAARPFPSSPRSRGGSATDARWLRRWGRIWHAWTLLYTVPFIAAGVGLIVLEPLAAPVALAALRARLDHPRAVRLPGGERGAAEGPAQRGGRAGGAGPARRPARPRRARASARDRPRAGARRAGRLAAWARPARCSCRPAAGASTASAWRATERELPPSDRIAHLLLALRVDEEGFATVANHAFAGAPWRVGGGCPRRMRPALDAARLAARVASRPWLRRRHRGRRVRRAVRGAPARAPAAAAQRAHHRSSPTRTSCSTRRCSRAPRPARSSRATWWCRCARSSSGPTFGSAG